VLDNKEVRVSALAGAAVILVCRGANRIYIPVPDAETRDRATEGVAKLPKERRELISFVDQDGDVLARVLEYVRPLRQQATKWPENAFAGYLANFLYEIALASKHKTPVASSSLEVVRGFVPLLDPLEFHGEAHFRVAECVGLICGYDSGLVHHGCLRADIPAGLANSPGIWKLLDFAEFRAIAAASGELGFLKNPFVGLRRLGYAIKDFFQRPETQPLLTTASVVADLAGVKHADQIGKLAEHIGNLWGEDFRPPFIPLGPVEMGLYRSVLFQISPEVKPPEGSILAFEGRTGVSWLNVGDESKLEREAADVDGYKKRVVAARAAQSRFF
jgi:hypothetical protein